MKKLFTFIIALVLGISAFAQPAFADTDSTSQNDKAAILTNCASKSGENGEGIKCILNLVVDIMTVGVGILAAIGLGISGIQYLTAGGNEEQTRKAKRRIFEIVIGLLAYVLIYAFLKFILPDSNT